MEVLGSTCFPHLVQVLKAAYILWPMTPPSIFPASSMASINLCCKPCFHGPISSCGSDLPTCLPPLATCAITLGSLADPRSASHRHSLHWILVLFLCKVPLSQVPLRSRRLWGCKWWKEGHYLFTIVISIQERFINRGWSQDSYSHLSMLSQYLKPVY